MNINELGTIFMLWWITMGVVYALWSINTEREDFEEYFRKYKSFVSYEGLIIGTIAISLIVWPIGIMHDLYVKVILKIVRKIKRGF